MVNAGRYGSVEAVADLVGDIIKSNDAVINTRSFGTDTQPSSTHVEHLLDSYSAELNLCLDNYRYKTPVAESTDPVAHQYITHAVNCKVAAMLLSELPGQAWYGDDGGAPRGRQQSYSGTFTRAKTLIEEQKLSATWKEDLPILHGLRFGGTRRPRFTSNQFGNRR